jgi:hypothetical protein
MMLRRLPVVLRCLFGHGVPFNFCRFSSFSSEDLVHPMVHKEDSGKRALVCAVIVGAINPAALIAFRKFSGLRIFEADLSAPVRKRWYRIVPRKKI